MLFVSLAVWGVRFEWHRTSRWHGAIWATKVHQDKVWCFCHIMACLLQVVQLKDLFNRDRLYDWPWKRLQQVSLSSLLEIATSCGFIELRNCFGLRPNPSLTKPVIPIFLMFKHADRSWNAAKHSKNCKDAAEKPSEHAEHADDQREKKRKERKVGKGGFVRDGFG